MTKRLMNGLAAMARARGGNFATVTAFSAVPLLVAVALALDTGKMLNARATLQDAADAAALAAAALPHDTPQDTLDRLVQSFFTANGATAAFTRRTEVRLTERTTYVEVRAKSLVENTFALPGRADAAPVEVMARAGRTGFGSEVSVVVDLTSSMNFGMSWPHVSDALGDMLDRMRANGPTARFRVSLVPYNDRVNLGPISLAWLEDEALATLSCPPGRTPRITGRPDDDDGDDDDEDGNGLPDHVICVPGFAPARGLAVAAPYPLLAGWEGCLEPREETIGGNPFALDASPPDREGFLPTVEGFAGPLPAAMGSACPPPVITPTASIAAIERAVAGMAPAAGTGRFDEGLAWGWRLVSPEWQGEYGEAAWPAAAGTTQKHVMLFTDGHTTANEIELGRTRSDLGWNNGSTQMWDMIADQCARMKDDGVDITVFHVLGNAAAAPWLQRCASQGRYFGVQNRAEFIAAVDRAVTAVNGTPRLIH